MKIETIFNAMEKANRRKYDARGGEIYMRQYRAFRDRILRMGNDSEEAYYNGVSAGMDVREETIRQKDEEIKQLRNWIVILKMDTWDTPEEDEAWKEILK